MLIVNSRKVHVVTENAHPGRDSGPEHLAILVIVRANRAMILKVTGVPHKLQLEDQQAKARDAGRNHQNLFAADVNTKEIHGFTPAWVECGGRYMANLPNTRTRFLLNPSQLRSQHYSRC